MAARTLVAPCLRIRPLTAVRLSPFRHSGRRLIPAVQQVSQPRQEIALGPNQDRANRRQHSGPHRHRCGGRSNLDHLRLRSNCRHTNFILHSLLLCGYGDRPGRADLETGPALAAQCPIDSRLAFHKVQGAGRADFQTCPATGTPFRMYYNHATSPFPFPTRIKYCNPAWRLANAHPMAAAMWRILLLAHDSMPQNHKPC